MSGGKDGLTYKDAGVDIDAGEALVAVAVPHLSVDLTLPTLVPAIADAVATVRTLPQLTKLRSPLDPGKADLVSKDGHSALVQFVPTGSYEEAVLYIDDVSAAVDRLEARHPGFYVESAGLSTDKALDEEINGGLARAGLISIPVALIVFRLRGADVYRVLEIARISGEAVLVSDAGEELLRAGDCAAFPKGEANGHPLINRSDVPCICLEIGSRSPNDVSSYPGLDLKIDAKVGEFAHRDGTLYPTR